MKKVLRNNLYLLKLCFSSLPGYIILLVAYAVLQTVVVFIEHVYTIQYVLNVVEFNLPFMNAVKMILFTVVLVSLKLLLSGTIEQKITPKSIPILNWDIRKKLYEQAKNIDLACYDDPEFYDQFMFSIAESDQCIQRMLKSIDQILQGITWVVLSGIFFITIDPFALVFVLIPFILNVLLSGKINKLNFIAKTEKVAREKKRNYLHRVFYLNDYAKDIRLYPQIKSHLKQSFHHCNDDIFDIDKKYVKKKWALSFVKEYFCNNFMIDVLFIIYLLFKALMSKALSFSNVVVLYSSSRDFKNTLIEISEGIPMFYENSLYIEKIRTFLNYQPLIVEKAALPFPSEATALEFRNVSFAYNEKDGNIINNISFKLGPLDKVALVGYNGAGKTTLIKLIMRLYDPTEGEILLNGINIKQYRLSEYRQSMGVVFQDFKIYAASVKENVLLGEEGIENDVILQALKAVGFSEKLNTVKDGLDMQLTTEFFEEGINLSGGEGQKVAIARTLLSKKNLVILDEPSSALDPIAEFQLNKIMFEVPQNQTVIFISHRLSTTKKTDYILMMEKGQIIEQGTHSELLLKQGEYAKMWNAQAKQYNRLCQA